MAAERSFIVDRNVAVGRDYAALARRMTQDYGALKEVHYVSHFPDFEIHFVFERGTVRSGPRQGRYDVNFLSLGYAGEGPECAHLFLRGAGFDLSYDEITQIHPGAVILLEGGKPVVRYPDDPAAEQMFHSALDAGKIFALVSDKKIEALKAAVAANPSIVNLVQDEGPFKKPLLVHAIDEREVACALYLIDQGADINTPRIAGDYSYSPFYHAVQKGVGPWADAFKPLIAKFIELEPDIASDEFILPIAVRECNTEVLDYLIARGKSVANAILSVDWSPPTWNEGKEKPMCLRLLALGADINAEDEAGTTPLWNAAVRHRKGDIVRFLLEHGADPRIAPTRARYEIERLPAVEATKSEEVRGILREHLRG